MKYDSGLHRYETALAITSGGRYKYGEDFVGPEREEKNLKTVSIAVMLSTLTFAAKSPREVSPFISAHRPLVSVRAIEN